MNNCGLSALRMPAGYAGIHIDVDAVRIGREHSQVTSELESHTRVQADDKRIRNLSRTRRTNYVLEVRTD